MVDVRCVAPVGDVCGEAATWSAEEGALYWVDINRFLLHRLDYAGGQVRSFFFDEPVVALSLTDRAGTLLVALGSKLITFQPATDTRHDLGVELPNAPEARFNDGRAGPDGSFWIGSMGNNVGPNGEGLDVEDGLGALYRLTRDGAFEVQRTGLGISNTVCWSADGGTFYFGDTLRNTIWAFPYDVQTAQIGPPKVHFELFNRGGPDGSAIDEDGYLWNCRYGGGCVVRVAPDGSVDQVIEMPVLNCTTACFGGQDLKTLFVTTASADKAAFDRLAGSVFAIETPVRGVPERRFLLQG
ncbi:MAG: SMP-30/gluconolactonase/LRE family protein [Devosiaceae bacterium]|nr:SMP-30/gluconolactonase/LRE family protein [Devosiaceae bacterium MH13]